MQVTIRPARLADAPLLQAIELRAGERFRDVGLGHVADHDPFSEDELAAYASTGRSWVAAGDDDRPFGYMLVDDVDGNVHIEQVSVDPTHQGAGHGRALVEFACERARSTGIQAVTLTTFRDVEWNRPLYEHLGFAVMSADEIGPELAALCSEEAAHGLDPATRVCMRRLVS